MARQIANLAVAQLAGSLDAGDTYDLLMHKLREVLQVSREQQAATGEVRSVLQAMQQERGAIPTHMAADLAEYRRRLADALTLRKPSHEFTLTFIDRAGEDVPASGLAARIAANPRTALWAVAGSGKSAALRRAALELNQDGRLLVVFIDLKSWVPKPSGMAQLGEHDIVTIDELLEASIVPLNLQFVRNAYTSLADQGHEIWCIDGINELSSDLSDQVLASAISHMRTAMRSSIVATDRSDSRYSGPDWAVIRVNQLTEDEVARHLPALPNIPEDDLRRRDLLRTPFFLDMAIRDGTAGTWKTSVQAIYSLFHDRLGLSNERIDAISSFAYSVYELHAALPFDVEELEAAVGTDVATKLLLSAVVEPKHNSRVAFYHQLIHDYLASRYVAHDSRLWVPRTFDALSFDANTFEATLMVLDQLSSENDLSQYLTAFYDWNWFGTVRCIVRALEYGWSVPLHLRLVVSAMLAEKRFDPVVRSRHRAQEWSKRLDEVTGYRFSGLTTLADVVDDVRRLCPNDGPPWATRWHRLYAQMAAADSVPSETDVAALASDNPFIGWTAAVVIRRCSTDDALERQVRAIYTGAENAQDDTSRSIRWRVVHSLGTRPSHPNARLLLHAIDRDPYGWVVYGAVRSLLEMAVLASGSDERAAFLSEVEARLPALPAEPLAQLAAATLYEGAPTDWAESVLPLLRKAYELQHDDEGRALWTRRMEAFRVWSSRSTP
jgi:hypothetical protein